MANSRPECRRGICDTPSRRRLESGRQIECYWELRPNHFLRHEACRVLGCSSQIAHCAHLPPHPVPPPEVWDSTTQRIFWAKVGWSRACLLPARHRVNCGKCAGPAPLPWFRVVAIAQPYSLNEGVRTATHRRYPLNIDEIWPRQPRRSGARGQLGHFKHYSRVVIELALPAECFRSRPGTWAGVAPTLRWSSNGLAETYPRDPASSFKPSNPKANKTLA